MLHKTRGIILKTTKYSESSLIIHLFTEKFGFQSYLVSGSRSGKGKIRSGMLQPLFLLEMVVYHKGREGLQRASEIRNEPILTAIPFDVLKSSIGIFMAEIIYRSVRQQGPDENLFGFLFSSIQLLDMQTEGLANFHLVFLIRLSKYLGFHPSAPGTGNALCFDLKTGIFSPKVPVHPLYLTEELSRYLISLMDSSYETAGLISLSNEDRRLLIDKLIEYYEIHLEGFGQMRSHEVLKEVLG